MLTCNSNAGEGIVAAERHWDPVRAQLSAAAAVGGATALVSWGVGPLLGLQAPALLSAESAFWSFLVAASAGTTPLMPLHQPTCQPAPPTPPPLPLAPQGGKAVLNHCRCSWPEGMDVNFKDNQHSFVVANGLVGPQTTLLVVVSLCPPCVFGTQSQCGAPPPRIRWASEDMGG